MMKNALITTLVLWALWFGLTDAIGTPAYIFPGPMATAQAFYDHAGILWGSFSITAGTMLLGFSAGALLGLGFGTLMALFPAAEKYSRRKNQGLSGRAKWLPIPDHLDHPGNTRIPLPKSFALG